LSFWHYVLKALSVREPLPQERGTRPLLALLINEVSARPGKMTLLIDDYHLIQSHAIAQRAGEREAGAWFPRLMHR